nr:hybrid sensor histidine kinase/response regulator [Fundidesulfovibrio agrisoli]
MFSIELSTHCRAIEDGLVGLEGDPRPELLESLMRAAHSIKGAARIVDLPQAVGLAHAMEDVFQAAQQEGRVPGKAQVDALLAANDFFARLAALAPKDLPQALADGAAEAAALEAALRALPPDGHPAGHPDTSQAAPAAPEGPPGVASAALGAPLPAQAAQPRAAQDQGGGQTSQAGPDGGVVRLSAELLGRLMGLAGQCIVESGQLGRVFEQARAQRRGFLDLADLLSQTRALLPEGDAKDQLDRAAGMLRTMHAGHSDSVCALDGLARRMEILSDKLYHQVLGSRMRPFGEGARALPRLVRDLAQELGKQARFVLEGANASVDRDILDRLEAPLLHLTRNAVDHGLEPPEERVRSGKPQQGRILLVARHVAGSLELRLSDDGCGIDPEAIRASVQAKGLAPAPIAQRMTDSELFEFLFLPGFTTAAALTSVSGRGVGLDVVKTVMQEVGGQVRVESTPGQGTAFVMRLPVSRSVVRALVVRIGGEPYAMPLARIGRVLLAPAEDVQTTGGMQYLRLDHENVGLAQAAQILGVPPAPLPGNEDDPTLPVMLLEDRGARFGLAVEAFLGERDLVVHPLDPRLGKVPGVAAASTLDDGSPVLILDDADLLRSLEGLLAEGRLAGVGAGEALAPERAPKSVLVVDDSLTVREVQRQLLEGRGYRATTAVDGMEGLALARMGSFDLIITDVDMPRMTGIELTRRIRADAALARTPVMIVSYKDRQEDRMAGLEAGADFYLAKSGFRDEALLQAVADLIGEP